MEHISPQSLMTYSTHSSVSPDPMFPMDGLFCPPTHTLSVTKPVKKRKSWGQELPEPKTNLPPRKRAKTEDEKEQRRIERIKRNRAAAHNSRERKRQEAEGLAVANEKLVHTMKEMQRLIDVQAAQLKKCKEQLGGSLPEMSEEETEIFERRFSEQSTSSTASHSPCSSSTIDPRASLSCSTPATSPENTPYIKMEDNMPSESNHESLSHESLFASLNPTQHSAAMLCDLQCRLSAASSSLLVQSTSQIWVWTQTILFLTHLSVMTMYKTTLLALWTQSPTQMNNLLATLTHCSTLTLRRAQPTTSFPTPPPRWSTLAQHLLLATGLSSGESALALHGVAKSEWSIVSRSLRRSLDQGPSGFDHFEDNSIARQEKVNHDSDNDNIRNVVTDSKNVRDGEVGFGVNVPPE